MDVSIIIPYYNTGMYLQEALDSISAFKNHPVYKCEVIIVNDGSTDAASLALLSSIQDQGYIIINQQNKGAAAARNAGMLASTGNYLLFLDSDNKLRDVFINKGVPILQNEDADIVYGKAKFFGASGDELFRQDVFHLPTLMARNYIDACCLFKRKVYETIGGMDEAKVLNQEDWEYWIRAGVAGFKFRFVDEFFYDYRVHEKSTTNSINDETYHAAREYVYRKYPEQVLESYFYISRQFNAYREDKNRPLRSLFKFLYQKYLKKKENGIPD
jgi:glycosyltransferase involved in cell wall biosynthesis